MDYYQAPSGFRQENGSWHAVHDDYEMEEFLEDKLYARFPEFFDFVPVRVESATEPGPPYQVEVRRSIDWEKVGGLAGLDQGQCQVLMYRGLGISRESALAQQTSPREARKLQAAWRRLDRTGMAILCKFLKTQMQQAA